ncbi:MAG TPA: hypothetical protein VII57_10905 [Dehalococcoidia bacterium]
MNRIGTAGRRRGGEKRLAAVRSRLASLSGRLRLPFSSEADIGVAAMAGGLAVIVSFLAVLYAQGALRPFMAEASSAFAETSALPAAVAVGHAPALEQTLATAEAAVTRREDSVRRLSKGRVEGVRITFYDCLGQGFCGKMASGRRVYEGAAACSWDMAAGTKFVIQGDPTGRVYTCEDRGLLTNTWVDIFWRDPANGWRWQAAVGSQGSIDILETPR